LRQAYATGRINQVAISEGFVNTKVIDTIYQSED